MESKKINQLATNLSPVSSDLTVIGDPTTGELKKITLLQIASIFGVGIGSIGMVVPSGFSVSPATLTANGTFTITGAGTTAQYIRGDGSLATFPTLLSSDSLIQEVRNNSGATMLKGTIVYINGAVGNKATIAKALATTDALSSQTYGVVQDDITNNSNGYVVVVGEVTGLNTSVLTEGQQLYLSGTVAGYYTTTKPYAPIHLVYVAIVLRSHPTLGVLGVKIQNGYEMDELHNVSAQSPSNNDGLFYNTSTSLWSKNTIAGVLGYTPFNLPSLTSGSVLFSNGTTIAQDNANFFWDDTNNRLGIGTATPYAKITTSVSGTFTTDSNDSDYSTYGLWIGDTNPTNAIGGSIGFGNITGGRKLAAIAAYHEADADQVGLKFYVQPTATGSSAILTEGMYLTSQGNLGINTATPDSKIHAYVSSGSIQTLLKLENGSVSASSGSKISFTEGGVERAAIISQIGTGTTPYLSFENNAAERMRIFSDGNVGINTGATNAGYKLDVNGTGRFQDNLSVIKSGNALLTVQASTNTSPVADIELMRGTNATWGADGYGDYRFRNSGGDLIIQYGDTGVTTTRLTIGSTGASTFTSTVTASSLIKSGGTSAQILAADGSVITAGTNITISAGTISAASSNFYTTDGTLTSNRTISSGGFTLSITPATTFTSHLSGISASFSSFIAVSKAGSNTVGGGPYVVVSQPTSSIQYLMQLNASAGLDFWHYNGTSFSTPFKISTTGEATFLSSVTATSFVKSSGTSAQILAADGSVITAGTNITISAGTISAAGVNFYTTDGTLTSTRTITAAGFGLTYSDNKNGQGAITISNTTAGTSSAAGLIMTSDASSGNGIIAKLSSTHSGSAIATSNDFTLINYTAGDIVLLNTFATGLIKFGVGTGTTPLMTLTNDGHLLIGTVTNSTYHLDINGDANANKINIAAGTATRCPLDFTPTSAVLKTTPIAGNTEVSSDGKLYYTHNTSERGVIDAFQFFKPNAIISLVSQTAAQPIFNTITNGAVTLKSATNYLFEVLIYITGMSTTSGTFGFAIGGTATFSTIAWQSLGSKVNNIANTASHQSTFNVTTSNATLVTASAFATGYVRIWGSCRVLAGGTFIPQISLGVAAAASINPQSYFKITAISDNLTDYIGNWS